MSGPGGETVGRVSVKVSPDTGSFASELRRELRAENLDVTVPVRFEFDRDQFRRDLDDIVSTIPTITIPVQLGDADGDTTIDVDADTDPAKRAVDEFVAETAARKPKVTVQTDVDRSAIDRILSNLKAKAKIDVDFDHFKAQMERAFAATENVGKVKVQADLDRSTLQVVSNAFRDLATTVGGAFRSAFGLAQSGVDELGGSIGGINASLGSAVSLIAKVGAGGFLIAEAGATITAAWGAVSTAIAAVPAAIALIGAPIATVMLGMDGIKKAAQALKPEFDRLKASVSATFEQGLKPVFAQLKGVMDALTPSVNAVATQLVGLAQRTADWITKAGGLALVQTMFNNVAAAINGINLNPLLEGFTRLAGNQAALRVITGLIEDIGAALQSIADNPSLNEAFDGLREVIGSLTRAFTDLVNNGIKVFAAAWPGVKTALDGLSEFFGKFDWARIGAAVGNALKGIGDAFKSIPPATVEAITKSFERLGQVLGGPTVQGAIRAIADSLPGLVDAVSAAIDGLADVIIKIQSVGDLFGALVSGDAKRIEAAFNNLFKDTPPTVEERLKATGEAIKTGGAGMATAAGEVAGAVPPAITGPLLPVPGQVGGIASQIPPALTNPLTPLPGLMGSIMGQVPPAVTVPLTPLPAQVGGIASQIPPAMTGPLSTLPGVIGPIFGALPGIMTAPIEPLPGIFGAQGHRITAGFGSGLQGMSPELQAQLGLLPPVATTGMGQVGAAVTTGLAGIAAGVPAALVPLSAAFTAGFAAIAATVPTTFTLPFQTALTTAFTAITAQIPTLFTLPFTTALTAAFAEVSAQIPTIFTVPFQTALTTGFTAIFAAFPTIFTQPFQTALTTAMQTVVAQFPALVTTPMQTALTTAFTTIFAAFPTIFTTPFITALTTGINAVVAQIPTLFTPVNAAFTAAFAAIVALIPVQLDVPMVAAVTLAMTNVNTAIVTGFAVVVASVTDGANQVIDVLNQLPPAGQATGQNLITAMANAILAGQSQLVNAIAQVISAAIAAATQMLQIGSPSKVFWRMGEAVPQGAAGGVEAKSHLFSDAVSDMVADGIARWDAGTAFDTSAFGSDLSGLSASVMADSSATLKAAPSQVNVWIGDEPFRGQIRSEIGSYDNGLRRGLAVRGGRRG